MKDVISQKQYFLTYTSVYSDFDLFDITNAICSVPTYTAIEKICYMLSQVNFPWNSKNSVHVMTFFQWVLRLTKEDNHKVSKVIREKNLHSNPDFRFIDKASSLMLIEYLLEYNNKKEQSLSREQESNLFKSYLWCVQKVINKQREAFNYNINQDKDELISKMLPAKLNFAEVESYKDYRIQVVKIIYFFKFCENDTVYKDYLKLFLNNYKLDSWEKYLLNLLTFYLNQSGNEEITPKFKINEKNTQSINFINNLSTNESSFYQRTDDFKELRNKPILKYGDNYLFLFFNFFVDKIYQGLLFDFVRVLKLNDCPISDFAKLKTDLGQKFSEHIAFYNIMDICFKNYSNVRLKGEQIKEIVRKGEPDYYMRNGNNIFLFEFKDSTLNEKIKHSGDFNKIRTAIIEKFEETSKNQKKGVKQLIASIINFQNSMFNRAELDIYDSNETVIYPIIVLTDSSFETEGINYLMKNRFIELLESSNVNTQLLIKELVLINIDTLIALQDVFNQSKLDFRNCINEYHAYSGKKDFILNRLYSFDKFLFQQAFSVGYRYRAPKEFKSMINEQIEKEKNN
ncbi:MAG TPA: hypothetical protein VGA80_03635 [Flavobacteriaceae bacterium]